MLALHQVSSTQMHVIEHENDETLGHDFSRRGGSRCGGNGVENFWRSFDGFVLFDYESRHDLRLAVVEDLEIFFLESSDLVALLVANEHGHQHDVYIALDCERGYLCGWGVRLLRGERAQKERQDTYESGRNAIGACSHF